MNLNTANLAIKVSVEKANDIGGKFCVAVMDAGVNLVAFGRMDGGRVGTIDVAMKKGSKIQYFFAMHFNHVQSRQCPHQHP